MSEIGKTWDARYGTSPEYYYGTEPNDFLRANFTAIPKGGRVLCLAEGEGRNAVYLARHGYSVTAIDGSRVGLDKLSRLAREFGVSVVTVHADLNEYAIAPGEWDGIVSIWAHLPPELRRRIHRESVAGLRPGGVFLLEAYRPKQLEYKTGGPPTADLMMTLESLCGELGGLEVKIAREIDRDVEEGKGHSGLSAVVQFLGVKSER
ncbi:MAG: class I SAM-dependent methyltransferase [Bdellovibrionales bacterium]|nr:class I SAM-dependent methyltransferase [Bdellovibrionales bacterium]